MTNKNNTNTFIWWNTAAFRASTPAFTTLDIHVQMAGLKRVPKYKWLRTETVAVTQGQHSNPFSGTTHNFLRLLCLHRLGGCGGCLLYSLLCHAVELENRKGTLGNAKVTQDKLPLSQEEQQACMNRCKLDSE